MAVTSPVRPPGATPPLSAARLGPAAVCASAVAVLAVVAARGIIPDAVASAGESGLLLWIAAALALAIAGICGYLAVIWTLAALVVVTDGSGAIGRLGTGALRARAAPGTARRRHGPPRLLHHGCRSRDGAGPRHVPRRRRRGDLLVRCVRARRRRTPRSRFGAPRSAAGHPRRARREHVSLGHGHGRCIRSPLRVRARHPRCRADGHGHRERSRSRRRLQ